MEAIFVKSTFGNMKKKFQFMGQIHQNKSISQRFLMP
jgi:hypothetical protein